MGWRSRGLNPIRVLLALMSSPIRLLYLLAIGAGPVSARSPHIIMILADDMGWNDVGFHGSNEIPTPNIDALAYNGIILNKHYVQPMCSPSRGALMTGMYPIHLGMQGLPFFGPEARGLPPQTILPQYLRQLGYSTHGIGKWHLGYASNDLLPTRRGFDSFLGYYNGYISYYDHIHEFTKGDMDIAMSGHDFRRNESNAWDLQGRYATDVFTEEAETVIKNHDSRSGPLFLFLSHLAVHAGNEGKLLEAPQEDINLFRHITDPNRRTYAAMMHRLDQSVGKVVRALDATGMLSDSIIVFMSDNGAATRGVFRNWGSNYPLRGIKQTLWEGSVRGAALIWSPRLYGTPRVSEELFHISDWLPTLYTAAGGRPFDLPRIDGIDQWSSLRNRLASRRNEVLINIDEISKTASVISGQYKLVVGTQFGAEYDGHYGQSTSKPKSYSFGAVSQSMAARAIASTSAKTGGRVQPPSVEGTMQWLRNQATVHCHELANDGDDPTRNGTMNSLYNLVDDPCERRNLLALSSSYKYKEQELKTALKSYYVGTVRQVPLTVDFAGADPKRFGGAWSPWLSDLGIGSFEKPDSSEDQSLPEKPNKQVTLDKEKEYDEGSNTTDGVLLDNSQADSDDDLTFDT